MIDDIISGALPCDVIVVHSFSRFFRDNAVSELTIRALAKRKVRVISITQRIEESPEGRLLRQLISLFDEFTSNEISKHVTRAHHENALQGFHNGSVPIYGYRSVTAEIRGGTHKKILDLEPDEAAVMRMIFDLALEGDGTTGPMGVKAIVKWLNDRGYKTRQGNAWGVSALHRLLSSKTYAGIRTFNSNFDGGRKITTKVNSIISEAEFEQLREMMDAKNPKSMPPRVVTGDVLLTGLVTCPECGNGMTTSTGKGGRYRYYACSNKMRTGTCKGRRVPMEECDALVVQHLNDEFLNIENIDGLLKPLRTRQERSSNALKKRLVAREKEVQSAKRALDNLYSLLQADLVDLDDPEFKERFLAAKENHKRVHKELDQVTAELSPEAKVTHESVARFVETLKNALSNSTTLEKRSYLRSIVDEIVVGTDKITICGRHAQIEKAIVARQVERSAVPTFVREWRRDRDSNPGNPLELNGFRNRPVRPLRHLSAKADM